MLRRTSLTAATVALLIPLPALAVPQDLGVVPSVALADDASAVAINPAGLGAHGGGSVMFNRQGWSTGTTRLMLNAGNLGLGYTSDTTGTVPSNDFVLGLAMPLAASLRLGANYHLPAEGRPSGMDVGLLTRPANYLSLGLMIRNAFGVPGLPAGATREYQLGAAFRPFGDMLTLSADVPYPEGAAFTLGALNPFLGLGVEPWPGIKVQAQIAANGDYRVGLALHGSQLGLGAMGSGSGSGAYVRMSSVREQSVLVPHGNQWATLDVGEALAIAHQAAILGPIPSIPAIYPLDRAMGECREDPQVGALILKIRPMGAGWATLEEVREAIARFKTSGKPVWAYMEDGDFKSYYVASACDRIFLNPLGGVELAGVASEQTHFKGLMDSLGIKAQFIAMGRYKTAMEPFERTDVSPAQREQTQALLDDQFLRVIAAISHERHLTIEAVRSLVDKSIFEASEAQAAGLVDELAHRDEVPKRLETALDHGFTGVDALTLAYRARAWAPPVIAIVTAEGEIVSGSSGPGGLMQGERLGDETLIAALRAVRDDGDVRAVVFRIDSPGGSSLASETIRRELVLTAEKKPVVISMGDVAASGGYWVSMIPDVPILADPGTITGSIGVFVGKFSLEGLLTKWGISTTTIKDGLHADMDSMTHPYTAEEEALLRANGELTYGRFVHLVANQRNLSEGRVRELASGRVYTGAMALGLGLVDRLAGLEAAIEEARKRAGIDHQEFDTEFLPQNNPLEAILGSSDGQIHLLERFSLRGAMLEAAREAEPWVKPGVWLIMPNDGAR